MGGTLVTRLAEEHPDDIAGLVLVNPAFGTRRIDAKFAPYIAWAVRPGPAIGGDIKKPGVVEPAYDRTPVVAFASLQQLWKVTVADLGRRARARPDVPLAGTTSSTTCRRELLQGRRGQHHRREVILEDSYHVATLDNDARRSSPAACEFIEARINAEPAPAAPSDERQRMTSEGVPPDDAGRRQGSAAARQRLLRAALRPAHRRRRRRRPAPADRARPGPDRRLPRPRAGRASSDACSSPPTSAPTPARSSPPRSAPSATAQPDLRQPADPLAGVDTDAAFDALVADWHVDTIAAMRDAERDLTREDADWRARLLTAGTGRGVARRGPLRPAAAAAAAPAGRHRRSSRCRCSSHLILVLGFGGRVRAARRLHARPRHRRPVVAAGHPASAGCATTAATRTTTAAPSDPLRPAEATSQEGSAAGLAMPNWRRLWYDDASATRADSTPDAVRR